MHPSNKGLLDLIANTGEPDSLVLSIKLGIDKAIKAVFDQRLKSANHYNNFLVFCCDVGRLDVVYYVLHFVDHENELLKAYIVERPNIQRIIDFSEVSDIARLQQLSMHEISQNDATLLKEHFLICMREMRESQEPLFLDNMVLSFSLLLLLRSGYLLLDCSECIEIINYFKNVDKTEQIRRNVCYLSILDYVLKHNLTGFFTLPKQHFNHLTYVQYAITSTAFLDKSLKENLFSIFKNKIKAENSLKISRKLKVAICISGLYRNHPESLESIKEKLIDPLEADVFIHTWSEMSYWTGYGGSPSCWRTLGHEAQATLPKAYHQDLMTLKPLLPQTTNILKTPLMRENNIDLFQRILNPKEIIVENEADFIASLTNPEGFTKLRGTHNQIKMFWGIKQSFDLALKADKYDVIIRIRPDMTVVNQIEPSFFDGIENNVFYSRVWPTTGITDSLFYSTDSVAYTFSRFVDQMMEKQELSPFDNYPRYDSHALFASWVYANNYGLEPKYIAGIIQVNPITKLDGLSEALDQDFHALTADKKLALKDFVEHLRVVYC